MDKQSAVQILNSRKLIGTEGKFTLKVTSASPFSRENKDGSTSQVMIVNFAAMTSYQEGEARKLFKAGDYQGATNLNMSVSQLPGQYVPSKGEIVDVEVGTINNKDGVAILVITSIIPRKAQSASAVKFSLDEEDGEEGLTTEEMREFLITSGEFTKVKAGKLTASEVSSAYAEAKDTELV